MTGSDSHEYFSVRGRARAKADPAVVAVHSEQVARYVAGRGTPLAPHSAASGEMRT